MCVTGDIKLSVTLFCPPPAASRDDHSADTDERKEQGKLTQLKIVGRWASNEDDIQYITDLVFKLLYDFLPAARR